MSQKEKLWKRLFHDPYPRDFTYNELTTLLSQLGYAVKQGRGSRIAFGPGPDGMILRLHVSHGAGENVLKRYQIMEVREFLKKEGVENNG